MSLRFRVDSGEHARAHCPVSVVADLGGLDPHRVALCAASDGRPVPVEVAAAEGGGHRLTWIVPAQAARTVGVYTLAAGVPAGAGDGVEVRQQAEGVDLRVGGAPFTTFHYGRTWSRPFLHPLIGPYGDPVTRAYPMRQDVPGENQDHPHHKSLWVAWGDVNGTDNWSEDRERGHATQVVRGAPVTTSGPCSGRLTCVVDWRSERGAKVLEETREVVVWNQPASGRAIDLTVRLRATEGPVRFGDTKEGGFCSVRVASSMDATGDGTITNSYGGTNEAETWGKRAHWCDYSGPVNGHLVGIAIFDHPSNLRYPTYWHVRNYGLMTANPFGLSHFHNDRNLDGGHSLAAGAELTFRYRVYCHAGTVVAGAVAERYHDFVNPPTVSVESP